ncbi:uncharacterized protein MEPE_00648 [Melanopsichium pennsylvanicum]|uniref:Metallo-beta-lactamase domain-containing protein n=2 Tax=Melanopsichium pennsylvanicum TaxID=63383 RepID=A0AAJ5C2W1_9BASI|nr:protein [Melanopsichium pennsylvanicum 4]SNX81943.1 uncharacterized protein MEPE_00648 [Melanopsichium pennsylvanicum]
MTNSHGYVLEYPRIRVDHFDQAHISLPASLLSHRRSISKIVSPNTESLPFAQAQTHFDKPLLYLLTHIHTDHLKGLDRPGITAPIYCSAVTKKLLLKYERQNTRIQNHHHATHTNPIGVVRPYAHLRVTHDHATAKARLSGYHSTSLDLLHPLPYNTPTKVQYTPTSTVTLTLIESNHMFGGTMFLIQGAQGAVLHTGDMRAENWWCDALTRNPILSPYLCWSKSANHMTTKDQVDAHKWADHIDSLDSSSSSLPGAQESSQSQNDSLSHHDSTTHSPHESSSYHSRPNRSQLRLRNIYLDTELLLCNQTVPTKQAACLDMITLMRLYPPSTIFFLNCWTWGYEDMLIYTAKAFGCKIHVDRFKYTMYKAARSEIPFLAHIVTKDGTSTRFHACEKRNVCAHVQKLASRYSAAADSMLAKQVLAAHSQTDSSSPDPQTRWGPPRSQPEPMLVYINPGQVSADRWPNMLEDTKLRLQAAQRGETAYPEALVVPIERHSTLPELQKFVGLFRPKTVSPNTILDPKGGLDYYLLHHLFGHVLAGAEDTRKLADEGFLMLGDKTWSFYEAQLARAREQAQTNPALRGGDAAVADSNEAVHAASASLNHITQSVGESIDAFQLEKLSKLRGISFKGLMMQNMAGNLAAMLEIERWRRVAGIDEQLEGLDMVIEDSMGSTQEGKADVSVRSIDYDADHSQLGETQALPLKRKTAGLHVNEAAKHVRPASPQASSSVPPEDVDEALCAHAPSCAPPPPPPLLLLQQQQKQRQRQSIDAVQTQDSQSSAEEASTELTEHLASRYINVLIHHFNIPFHRSDASYISMWKTVRENMPEDAQKVEEHWFRETGVLPPLWNEESDRNVPPHQSDFGSDHPVQQQRMKTVEAAAVEEDEKHMILGEIFSSFVDMLNTIASSSNNHHVGLVPASTTQDRTVALQLILAHFSKLGFHNRMGAETSIDSSGESHGSCLPHTSSAAIEWKALSVPLTALTLHLTTELQNISTKIKPSHDAIETDTENATLALHLTGILLAHRPINTNIETSTVLTLLDSVISIVEAVPKDISTLSKKTRNWIVLASAILRAEELDEVILEPFEDRLLRLAQDSDGPLRMMGSIPETETGLSASSQSALSNLLQTRGTDEFDVMHGINERVMVDDEEASSLQIRAPRVAGEAKSISLQSVGVQSTLSQSPLSKHIPTLDCPLPRPTLQTTSEAEVEAMGDTDSIMTSQKTNDNLQGDTIESISAAAAFSEASQASSATQEEEEDETMSEESPLASLPVGKGIDKIGNRDRQDERRNMVKSISLPSFMLTDERMALSKRRIDTVEEDVSRRRTRQVRK